MCLEPSEMKQFQTKFLEKVELIPFSTCWHWVGGRTSGGYGMSSFNKKRIYAHRLSHELFKGVIPIGLHVDHLCRNPGCVNPEHLEAVTCAENLRRSPVLPWFLKYNSRKAFCKRGHSYSEDNLYRYAGKRHCRACRTLQKKQMRKAHRHEQTL